jgi:hypothetical protein
MAISVGLITCTCAIFLVILKLAVTTSTQQVTGVCLTLFFRMLPSLIYLLSVNFIESSMKLGGHDGSIRSIFRIAFAKFAIGIAANYILFSHRITLHVITKILVGSIISSFFDALKISRGKHNRSDTALPTPTQSQSETQKQKTRHIRGDTWTRRDPVMTRSRTGALSSYTLGA